MDGPSESASALPWLWVIEALAGFREINTSTLQGVIDVAPVKPDDFCKNTRELIAIRCLEELFASSHEINRDASSSVDSRVEIDFSRICEDVLQQILNEIPLSNLKMDGTELLKWDVFPFIIHKRASTIKCQLEQLKESLLEGTHPCTDHLKERSGLALQNAGYPGHVNDGECNDLLEKDHGNSACAKNMGAKGNSVSSSLENGNRSSKEELLDTNCLPFKRNRVYLADEHVTEYLQEKQVCINESDDFLRNTKKIRCYASANLESKKEKPGSQHGNGVPENSTERILLISEKGGHLTEQDNRVTLGEGLLEDSHGCMTTTIMPRHTCGDEPCQNTSSDKTKDETENQVEPILTNVDDANKIRHMIDESQSKLTDPNAESIIVSQKLAPSETAVVDAVNGWGAELSSDSDGYQNEKIDLAAKKHEFLSSQLTLGHDFSASVESTEQYLCMKCNEGGQLLICKTTTCPLMVHKNCLGVFAQFDAKGNFFCPFCTYSHAISEYLEAKKKASLARKELAIFISKGIRHQAAEREIVNNRAVEVLSGEEERDDVLNSKSSTGRRVEKNEVPADRVDKDGCNKISCINTNIVSANQSNTGDEMPKELLKQHNTDGRVEPVCAHDAEKEEISEHECDKHVISRYTMRVRKHETQYKPQASPQLRRKKIPWTAEEEELIREGVQKFGVNDPKIPWKKILAFGSHVFEKDDKQRTPQDLKDKWKNMCRAHSKVK